MVRSKKHKLPSNSIIEDWKLGKRNPLNSGQVVRLKNSKQLGVIGAPCYDIDTYEITLYDGPNPWDKHKTIINASKVIVVNEPNPLKYNMKDRFNGPSFEMIHELNKKIIKKLHTKNIDYIEKQISALEEEINTKRGNPDDLDSVVSEDDESPRDYDTIIDPVEKKRMEILSEE